MKISSKLLIALTITMILSFVSISVWAAPLHQGTVPIIPVTGGTFTAETLCDCQEKGLVTRITDPENEVSPAPAGFAYLSDALEIELEESCDIEICYPYPKEYEDKKGQIFIWDSVIEKWGLAESTIYGEPKQICTVDKTSTGNIFALISSDEILSPETPSKVILCGCGLDDTVTTIEDPETEVGSAPDGMVILTDATQVNCDEECEIEVCFPFTEDYKLQDGQIYKWDEDLKIWGLTKSTINEEEDRICTLNEGSVGGIFTLIGK